MLANTFIVSGDQMEAPQVHVLSPDHAARLRTGLALASRRGSDRMRRATYAAVFGLGVEYAFNVSLRETLEYVVASYAGPHAEQVKAAAALLALGQPLAGPDEPPEGPQDPKGGQPSRLMPEPPRRPPGGQHAVAPIPAALRF